MLWCCPFIHQLGFGDRGTHDYYLKLASRICPMGSIWRVQKQSYYWTSARASPLPWWRSVPTFARRQLEVYIGIPLGTRKKAGPDYLTATSWRSYNCPAWWSSGGSRNFERGVQQVGWHIHSALPKAVRRAAKRGKIFLRVLFSDQEALSWHLCAFWTRSQTQRRLTK